METTPFDHVRRANSELASLPATKRELWIASTVVLLSVLICVRRYSFLPDSPDQDHRLHTGLRICAGDHRSCDGGSAVRPGRPTPVSRVPGFGFRLPLQRRDRDSPCPHLPRGILRSRLARGERPDHGVALRFLARRLPDLRPLLCIVPGGQPRPITLCANTRLWQSCPYRLHHWDRDWPDVPCHGWPPVVADHNPGRQLLAPHFDGDKPCPARIERSRTARPLEAAQAHGARRLAHGGDEHLSAGRAAERGRHVRALRPWLVRWPHLPSGGFVLSAHCPSVRDEPTLRANRSGGGQLPGPPRGGTGCDGCRRRRPGNRPAECPGRETLRIQPRSTGRTDGADHHSGRFCGTADRRQASIHRESRWRSRSTPESSSKGGARTDRPSRSRSC